MRTSFLIGLIIALGVLIGAGPAVADSTVNYPDGSSSLALDLGGGAQAFVFFNDLVPPDVFVHAVDSFANLFQVTLNPGGFNGFAIFLGFEGFNQGFRQYGVYTCTGFSNQTCNVSGVRRGSYFTQ